MNLRSTIPFLAAFTISACGSNPTPVLVKPTAPPPAPHVEIAVAPPEVPLSDEAPKNMAVRLHAENLEMSWKNAERLLRTIGVVVPSLPPDMLAMSMLGPSIASVVDLSGSIDVAAFGKDFDRLAVAAPVAAEMQPQLGKVFRLRLQRGILRIVNAPAEGEDEIVAGALPACAFVGAEEESGARLVCASDDELLESTALYLGRTVVNEGRDGDVRLELRDGEIFQRIADEASSGNSNDWAEAAGERWAVSFFRDIEHLSLLGSWGKSDIEAEAMFDFRPAATGFSRAISARVPLQSASTASFARLPKDAAIAMHGHAGHAQALVPMRDEFMAAFAKDLLADGYDLVLLDALNTQVSELFFTGGSYAFAYGFDRVAAEKALAAYAKDKKKPALRSAAFRALRGWSVFAVDEPAEKWTKGIQELVRVGNELDKKRNGGVAITSTTPIKGTKDDERTSMTMAVVATPAVLPKGSLHVEMRSRPLKTDAPPAYTKHLYVVPDGSRTWIGIGEDEAPMLSRLRAAKDGLTDQTIAGVPELANTVSQGAVAAGFMTIAGGTFLFLDDDSDEALDRAVKEFDSVGTLPGRGDGVIPWQIISEDAQNGGGRTRLKARLSLPVLGDIAEMAKR